MGYVEELREIVGPENVFDDRVECLAYSRDMSVHQGIPDVVVFARTTEQVSAIMKIAYRDKIPVIPRGTGTSVTGAVLPIRGGIVLDLHLMNNILEINKKDFYARLEPGVVCMQLNKILEKVKSRPAPRPKIAFIKGESVRINEGSFANFTGTVEEYDVDNGMLKLNVPIFGRITPVDILYSQVEKIEYESREIEGAFTRKCSF